MRNRSTISSLVLACLVAPSLARAQEPGSPVFDVQEWGVFPVPRSDAWAMRDLKAEWASFPRFFQGVLPERGLTYRGPVTKPVVWIHSQEEFPLTVEVRFEPGRPLIWWPPTEQPSTGFVRSPRNLLRWELGVGRPFVRGVDLSQEPLPELEEVLPGHWMTALRAVDSAALFVQGSANRGLFPQMHRESFLYYDGVMPAPPSPTVERTKDGWVVHSNLPHAAKDLRIVERRGGEVWISESWTDVAAGEAVTELPARALGASADEALGELLEDLAVRLHFEGLGDQEALALIRVWRDGLVGEDGLSLFYRVSKDVYDRWLPITFDPPARRVVRVGLVLHRHLEPELEARVLALLGRLDVPGTNADRAAEELAGIGGAAFPWMEHALEAEGPRADHCRRILESQDVLEYFLAPEEDEER